MADESENRTTDGTNIFNRKGRNHKDRNQEYEEFLALARPVLDNPGFQKLKTYIQHGNVTTYDHCIDVAWKAFCLNRRLHLKVNESDLVTACLLHDYYLYDWHTHGDRLHGFHHPSIAADHARDDFLVNKEIADAIRTHMWPLTFTRLPNSRMAWLLTLSDKICSANETLFHRDQKQE